MSEKVIHVSEVVFVNRPGAVGFKQVHIWSKYYWTTNRQDCTDQFIGKLIIMLWCIYALSMYHLICLLYSCNRKWLEIFCLPYETKCRILWYICVNAPLTEQLIRWVEFFYAWKCPKVHIWCFTRRRVHGKLLTEMKKVRVYHCAVCNHIARISLWIYNVWKVNTDQRFTSELRVLDITIVNVYVFELLVICQIRA
jgi:hypothetical protein